MLLLEDGEGGVFGVNPRIRDRVRAKLHADRLDRALAAGVSPDSDALLALRSQVLSSTSTRNGLAAGLERIILETTKPGTTSVRVGIPRCRRGVVENVAELDEVRRHLRSAGLLPIRCIAQASVLLTSGSGPLFRPTGTRDLTEAVHNMVAALNSDR
jgi:hypothetical protein